MLQSHKSELVLDSRHSLVKHMQKESDFFCLSTVIQENLPWLRSLVIRNQSLSPGAMRNLSAGLKTNTFIENLSFNLNSFLSEDSLSLLTIALSSNSTIKALDLSDNSLDDEMIEEVCELISSASSLEFLSIAENEFTHGDIGEALAKNTSLTHFVISSNPLSEHAVKGIAEALSRNSTLNTLEIEGIDSQVQEYLVQAIMEFEVDPQRLVMDYVIEDEQKMIEEAYGNYEKSAEIEISSEPPANISEEREEKENLLKHEDRYKEIEDSLSGALQNSNKQVNDLSEEIYKLKKEFTNSIQELTEKLTYSEKNSEVLHKKVEELEKNQQDTLEVFAGDLAMIKGELKNAETKLSSLEDTLKSSSHSEEFLALKESQSTLHVQLQMITTDTFKFQNEFAKLKKAEETHKQTKKNLTGLSVRVENKFIELEESMKKASHKQEPSNSESKISELEVKVKDLQSKIMNTSDDLENKMCVSQLCFKKIEDKIDRKQRSIDEINEILFQLRKKVTVLEREQKLYESEHLKRTVSSPKDTNIMIPEKSTVSEKSPGKSEKASPFISEFKIPHKKKIESQNYMPGQAESLVLHSISEKAGRLRTREALPQTSLGHKPSAELLKNLKQRGINVQDPKPFKTHYSQSYL